MTKHNHSQDGVGDCPKCRHHCFETTGTGVISTGTNFQSKVNVPPEKPTPQSTKKIDIQAIEDVFTRTGCEFCPKHTPPNPEKE